MKTLALAATAALFAATAVPALAQDAAPTDAAPASEAKFTGPRAEVFGGWDRLRTTWDTSGGPVSDYRVRQKMNGVTAGGLVGYDIPLGDKLVAGVFGSYAISTARSCMDTGGCIKDGREIEGGARIGYRLLDGKALGYVKGAYVNGQIRDTDPAERISTDRNAWRAGAGIEYALDRHAYTKIEYDYTKSDKFRYVTAAGNNDLYYDRNQVLVGLGIHF